MYARMITSLVAMVGMVALVGCIPTSGMVTGVSGPELGSMAPDVQYVSSKGEQGDFNKARLSIAVIVFSAPEAANCCWVDPKVVNVADQLWGLPVTVAQFSLPKGKCAHGQGCVEVCNLHKNRLISLCDAKRIAWNAYARPVPGSLILIGPDNKILMNGSLSNPNVVVDEAKRLGKVEKEKNRTADYGKD